MLTDIFAYRYASTILWPTFTERERRLVVQAYRIFAEDLCPYWKDGKEDPYTKPIWMDVQSRLSRELGLSSLSSLTYAYQTTWNGNTQTHSGNWSFDRVCETWMLKPFSTTEHIADTYVKERLSFR